MTDGKINNAFLDNDSTNLNTFQKLSALLLLIFSVIGVIVHFFVVREEFFVCRWNRGVAFSLFDNMKLDSALSLAIFSLAIFSIIMIILLRKIKQTTSKQLMYIYLLTFMLGSIGNIIDRWLYKAVCDYITLFSSVWSVLPVFNLNDIIITFSLGLILINIYRSGNATD